MSRELPQGLYQAQTIHKNHSSWGGQSWYLIDSGLPTSGLPPSGQSWGGQSWHSPLRFHNHVKQTWAVKKVSMFPLCICAHLCMIVFMCTFGVNLILSTYRMFKVLLAIILSIMCLSVFVCAHMSLINTNVFVFVHLWSRISHASWATVTQLISNSNLPRHKSLA